MRPMLFLGPRESHSQKLKTYVHKEKIVPSPNHDLMNQNCNLYKLWLRKILITLN